MYNIRKMLTAIVLTHNSEKSIEKTLRSVSFVDEIIVIDDYSVDHTLDIAKKNHARVVQHSLNNDFAGQKNYAMTLAKWDWILFIDADEVVGKKLKQEIESKVRQSPSGPADYYSAYRIKRQDYFWGKKMRFGEVFRARSYGFIRLVEKNSGVWKGAIHEEFETSKKVESLKGFLYHYPHPTITHFLTKINKYSSIRAEELYNKGTRSTLLRIIFYPQLKFCYTYFIRLGFLDGSAGFVYCFMMSFHSFLVWSKLFLFQKKQGV